MSAAPNTPSAINSCRSIDAATARRAVVVATLAAALLALGVRDLAAMTPGRAAVGVLEASAGLSFATLAAVYGRQAAGADVAAISRRAIVRWLMLPYRSIGRALLLAAGRAAREPARHALADGIVIGRMPLEAERAALRGEGIDAALCLCWEYPGLGTGDGLETARVPMLDGVPPTPRQLDEAVDRVVRWRGEGRRILIHCAQGHGRTATVAAACLVRLGLAPDANSAIAAVRAARPGARPSRAQTAALADYLAAITAGRA